MGGLIVTVTPNPAVDLTYRVETLRPGETHRVGQVLRRPGGKGVNVALVLQALGAPVSAVLPVGGANGEYVATSLAAQGIPVEQVALAGETRQTVTVVDGGGSTVFNEPGPRVSADEWDDLAAVVRRSLDGAVALVVSGSSPAGATTDLQAHLTEIGSAAGVPVVVDTSGPALLVAADAGPALVKPNAEELREATGEDDLLAAARSLLARGVGAVAVSLGHEGLLLVTGEDAWAVDAVPGVSGNPTGAGDATVAGLVRGLAAGRDWVDVLPEAASLGAAAVLSATAGEVDLAAYARFVPTLRTRRLTS